MKVSRFWISRSNTFKHMCSVSRFVWTNKRSLLSTFSSDETFEGVQTTAAVLSGIGMFFLFLSCCVPHPQTVERLSGTIFMLQAIAQASAIGIMTMLKKDFYGGKIRDLSTSTNRKLCGESCATVDNSPQLSLLGLFGELARFLLAPSFVEAYPNQ